MQSDAKTVNDYLASLPPERQVAMKEVRKMILENLPKGYQETMDWGMIVYEIPLEIFPDTYNKRPLGYVALASQKNYMSVYLFSIYVNEDKAKRFEQEYRATGKRYDVGKSCVRFRKLEDLPLELIAAEIRSTKMNDYIELVKESLGSLRKVKRK